jgi:hypothetical protein
VGWKDTLQRSYPQLLRVDSLNGWMGILGAAHKLGDQGKNLGTTDLMGNAYI